MRTILTFALTLLLALTAYDHPDWPAGSRGTTPTSDGWDRTEKCALATAMPESGKTWL